MKNYEQVKLLGEGGFGKAILAKQKSDGLMCVIKEVRLASLSPKDRNEALQEAKVLAALKHPNIVNYITSFQERGCFYIVMEYADGGDLSQKIEKRHGKLFSEDEILHDFIQICLAIKYIHDRKILHRDLKTQNIFLTKAGDIKLGDFGIAKVLEHTFQLARTQIGTPYYLSPEICEGKEYNAKTDIWSLGCILYELCTLQHAFQGGNMKGLMMNIVRGKVNPISSRYSRDLSKLINDMLTTNPKRRPTINDILSRPFIKSKLNSLLEKTLLDYEFSHTVLHGRKALAAPTIVISKEDKSNSLIDDDNENQDDNQIPFEPEKNENHSPARNAPQPSVANNKPRQQRQPMPRNLPSGIDPRYYRRQQQQQREAGNNVDPRYRNQRQRDEEEIKRKQRELEMERERQEHEDELKRIQKDKERERLRQQEEDRKKRAEIEKQRRKREEEIRRQKQAQKEKEIEENRKRIQDEIEAERRREEERKRMDEERKKKQLQQQALYERKKRLDEELEARKEEERMRRRQEAENARRQNEENERQRKANELKKQRELRDRQRKQMEEEEAEIKRREEERKRQKYLEQQREKEELEAEQRQLMEEEKRKKQEAARKQKELLEDRKRQVEEGKKRRLLEEQDDQQFYGQKPNQERKPAWVSPTDNDYENQYKIKSDDEYQNRNRAVKKRKEKPAWVSPLDNDNEAHSEPYQPREKQKRPEWVSPTDTDNEQKSPPKWASPKKNAQPERKKQSYISPSPSDYDQPQQPSWTKMEPKKLSIELDDNQSPNVMNKKSDELTEEERNQYMRQLRHEARANKQKAMLNNKDEDPNKYLNDFLNNKQDRKKAIQDQPPQFNQEQMKLMDKKFEEMTVEQRNEYAKQLRHEAQMNRKKAIQIQLDEQDNEKIEDPSNKRPHSALSRTKSNEQEQENFMNKKFDEMTVEEKNQYARQLRHEAQANRKKAMQIQLEEESNENHQKDQKGSVRRRPQSSLSDSKRLLNLPKENLQNKKFEDMTVEEKNEYARQLRHEAQANRQRIYQVQVGGDFVENEEHSQNQQNPRRQSPPNQNQQIDKPNLQNKRFEDMTVEEKNEYARQLRHEAQANRQRIYQVQVGGDFVENEEHNQQQPQNPRRQSPPNHYNQPIEQPVDKPNLKNKKFEDMTVEERNEYARQLRHEAQANRQRLYQVQVGGDFVENEEPNQPQQQNPRRQSPPNHYNQPMEQPVDKQNLKNKKFDDMTVEERNEYARQLRHEAQANRQRLYQVQVGGDFVENEEPNQQQPPNPRRQSPPNQNQHIEQPNLKNKKFDDMTVEERNEYARQLRHEAQANRQRLYQVQVGGDFVENEEPNQQQPQNPRRQSPPNHYNQPIEQPVDKQNLKNKKFDDMTVEERNEYARQLRHEAQANRQRLYQVQVGGDFVENEEPKRKSPPNNNRLLNPDIYKSPQKPGNDDVSSDDRNQIARQLRHEAAANKQRYLNALHGSELGNNDEGNGYSDIKDERIAKHEISEEDRRKIYEEQRAAFKAYRNRGRLIDNGNEAREAIEDPGYSYQPPPKDERIAKHEISEEDRRKIYEEQRAAFKAYRSRGRVQDNGNDAREAIEDSDYSYQPPKDERIAKHEISEEDRRKIYEEQHAAFKAYKNRGQVLDNERSNDVYSPPKDERIAKHKISEEDRRKIYQEQRGAYLAYKNRGRIVDSFVESPPTFADDNNQKDNFEPEYQNDIENNLPKWAKTPVSRHINVNNKDEMLEQGHIREKIKLDQQRPPPGSPFHFYDRVNDDDDEDDDSVNVIHRPIQPKADNQNYNNIGYQKKKIEPENDVDYYDDQDNDREYFGSKQIQRQLDIDDLKRSAKIFNDKKDNIHNEENDNAPEEIQQAAANMGRLYDLAKSIKEALDLPEQQDNENQPTDEPKNPVDNLKKNQIFYINDKEVSLPVACDKESMMFRIKSMRNYLESQIGTEKLNELNAELINKANDDNAPTPVINNLPPGLVCLAEQLLIIDGQNQNL